MNRLLCIAVFVAVFFPTGTGYGDEFSPDSIKSIMRKVAKYSFQQYGGGTAAGLDRDWSRGTIMTGIMGMYRVTQEKQWLDSVDKWGTKWNWNTAAASADDYCCMQTYCERYIVEPIQTNIPKYQPTQAFYDAQMKNPVANMLGWIDVLYMGPPGMAMLGNITGNRAYFDSLLSAWNGLKSKTFAPIYGLWWRDPGFVNSKTPTKGNPSFWGPGNAWVIGGWMRSLKYMPETYPRKAQWVQEFKSFCDTIKSKQQLDGMWRTSLYEPTEFPDPEAGSTSFFSYAFSLGVVSGILDANVYTPVIRKAWSALVKCVDAAGKVQRCQPWSLAPGGVGLNNTPEGQGAFLLAGEGVINLLTTSTKNTDNISKQKSEKSKANSRNILACFANENRLVVVPANTVSLTAFDVQGRLVFKKDISDFPKEQIVAIPRMIAAKGLFYIRFK
jgi:unsaturated rhamnogalacturonyl hydrolase